MKKIDLLIIDPQHDFCNRDGALFVPGADEDIKKLASMVDRFKSKLHDIHVTLDKHHFVDIAHPIFHKNYEGKHPDPFTIITKDSYESGQWTTTNPSNHTRVLGYLRTLEHNGRYPLCIWPPHCLIGSLGSTVHPVLFKSILEWEKDFAFVRYLTKGSNFWVEHYSAVQAEVPDPEDLGTQLDLSDDGLIMTIQKADQILISGQALSHCVANTIRDIANNFGEDNIKKFILLDDTTSSVPGFEHLSDSFLKEMVGRGMQVAKSTDF